MKPNNAGFYIDLIKQVQGWETDKEVAQALEISSSRIVAYRRGITTLDSHIALVVADLAQCSVGEIVFMMKAYKAYMADKNKIKLRWIGLSKEARAIYLDAKKE